MLYLIKLILFGSATFRSLYFSFASTLALSTHRPLNNELLRLPDIRILFTYDDEQHIIYSNNFTNERGGVHKQKSVHRTVSDIVISKKKDKYLQYIKKSKIRF